MRIGRLVTPVVVFLVVGGPLRAADKPMPPPKPTAEMSQLAFFAGNWTCKGKAFPTPFGPEHDTEATVAAKSNLGGFWYTMHYQEKKTAANPSPYEAVMVLSFDPGQKMFTANCFDSMGGACSQTSAGWKGNVLSFEGTMVGMGQKSGARDTFTKISATELKHAGDVQGSDGKWMPTDEETCTKSAKAAKK